MTKLSTWKLSHRRAFAVLEKLGDLAGTGIILADGHMPSGLTDSQQAMALAEGGQSGLGLVVETAGSRSGRWGEGRRIWKAMTPASGANAALFLAHGLAATTERLAMTPGHHLDATRQEAARALLRAHLPWTDLDEGEIANIEAGVDPDGADGLDHARLGLAFGTVRRVIGQADALKLPGFAPLHGAAADAADLYVVGLSWQLCWNQVLTHWLALTDPDGLAGAT